MNVASVPTVPITTSEGSGYSPCHYLILGCSFAAAMLDGFDILLMAFTAPVLAREWSISPSQLGVVFSSALLGMTMGAMFLASLADRHGRKIVISASLMVAGLGTLATAFTNSVSELIILRFIAGLGLGTLIATLPPFVSEYTPERHRNLMVAILMSCTSIGGVIGGLVSAEIIAAHGWRTLFLGAGALTVAMAVLFALTIPESLQYYLHTRPPGALQAANRVLARLGGAPLEALPEMPGQQHNLTGVRALLAPANKAVTLLAWSAFALAFATSYFLNSWTPKLVVDAGGSAQDSIRSAVILTLGSVAGSILFGWLSRWWRLNLVIMYTFLAGAGLILLWAFVLSGEWGIHGTWLMLALLGLTVNGGFTNLTTLMVRVYPAEIRSTGLGWCVGLGRVGAVLSPILAGVLLSAGLSTAGTVLVFAAPIAAAGVLIAKVRARY